MDKGDCFINKNLLPSQALGGANEYKATSVIF